MNCVYFLSLPPHVYPDPHTPPPTHPAWKHTPVSGCVSAQRACELVNLATAPCTDMKMYNVQRAEQEGGALNPLRNNSFLLFVLCGFRLLI